MNQKTPLWNCEFSPLKRPLEVLRVGDIFQMSCSASESPTVNRLTSEAQIVFEKQEHKYLLKILKAQELTQDRAEFLVTSYKVGEHKDISFVVTDEKTSFLVRDLSWTLQSVKESGKPYEMVGPMGPLSLKYPPWFWGVWLSLFLGILAVVIVFFAKKYKWKQAMEDVPRTGASAYDELQRALRTSLRELRKKSDGDRELSLWVQNLEKSFCFFIARTFRMPFHRWSSRKLRRILWKQEPVFCKKHGQKLFRTLEELKVCKEREDWQVQDLETLLRKISYVSDDVVELVS